MEYEALWHRLTKHYDADEAKAIVRWVLDVRFGMSWADILCNGVSALSADDQSELERIVVRIEKGEPVQYVLGVAWFCGRKFHVAPGVLIPRPETEELCRWIIEEERGERREERDLFVGGKPGNEEREYHILDIGTGSGCIACTLAAELPEAQVTAWDISDDALHIAAANAAALGATVCFEQVDVLNISLSSLSSFPGFLPTNKSLSSLLSPLSSKYHLIVSNPPYVCEREKAQMEPHVLDHEPSQALFVPDDDPLMFYRAIAVYSAKALTPGGRLFLEINPCYAAELVSLLHASGLTAIEVRNDEYGKQRMIKAVRP